jgi:ABC-type nitrate/sulfonate/bicarbonate transport system substrate-binding protein
MTFMPGYKPQANLPFVGAYVAQAKGFFAREGLDVTITHSPGRGEHLQLLATGQVHVTTQDAAVLLKRRADPGLPLVSIALIGQRGQQAFAALQSSCFESPKDWEDHLVGFKGTPPPDLFAMLDAVGADPALIDLVNVGFDPRVLTEGQVDVYPVYKSNEPFLIQKWGYELSIWDAADFGVPTLGLTYVTSDEILTDHPDTLTRFLRAVLDGIQYASANVEEAIEIVLTYTGPEKTTEQWQTLADLLVESGAMTAIDVNTAFSNTILELLQETAP